MTGQFLHYRVNCVGVYCTIAFEGTNILTYEFVASPSTANGLSLSSFAYVGIVVADFPGQGLIDILIGLNSQ